MRYVQVKDSFFPCALFAGFVRAPEGDTRRIALLSEIRAYLARERDPCRIAIGDSKSAQLRAAHKDPMAGRLEARLFPSTILVHYDGPSDVPSSTLLICSSGEFQGPIAQEGK
ncbi:hypothetical protein R1sor_002592 [Riccia sorocarpa]|uniref:Uncharacterized protein n=1 Tax=Riccia sorocarpa TaxID=122646 RepID=A0ABD3GZ90_9MARC